MFGALGALWLRGFELDVFSQIGMLMVIGLAAKERDPHRRVRQGRVRGGYVARRRRPLEGVRVRRRALFMTSFAFILGCVPLWTAAGAGAVGRRILGTVVIGGMLTDTLIASLFISVSFYVSERFLSKRKWAPAPAGPGVASVSSDPSIPTGVSRDPLGSSRRRRRRRPLALRQEASLT